MNILSHKPLSLTTRFEHRSGKLDVNTLNAILETTKQLASHPIIAGGGISGVSDSLGNKLLIPEGLRLAIGVIVKEGPKKEKDFDDARYWVSLEYVANEYKGKEPSKHANNQMELKEWKENDPLHRIIPVTNLAEIDTDPEGENHTHSLPYGLHILIFRIRDKSGSEEEPKFGPFTKFYTYTSLSAVVEQYILVSHKRDHLVCHTWSWEEEGEDDIIVAKEWDLRQYIWDYRLNGGRKNYGLEYQYETGVPWERVAIFEDKSKENQMIIPVYHWEKDPDEIGRSVIVVERLSKPVSIKVDGKPTKISLIHRDGREWASIAE